MKDHPRELVYLDYPATTPCDSRVFEKMSPYFCTFFGNPHSKNHAHGWIADEAVDDAFASIAECLRVEPREITFTSGASESNILAIRGVMMRYKNSGKNHLITTQTEHKSVLSCCRQLEEEGYSLTYLSVNDQGIIDLNELLDKITDKTLLISIAVVNNETGVIQPMNEIGNICKNKGIYFHTDATQALGKMAIDIKLWNVALASFSSHKVYGPKGIGALYLRKDPAVKIKSFLVGGGQQGGIRGGTIPVPLCVGFGEACKIINENNGAEVEQITRLSGKLVQGILENVPLSKMNGNVENKVPHIVNIIFPFVEGESIAMGLEDICVATGSACSSSQLEPSHVLKAMGVDNVVIQSSIRFGIGRFTTETEIDYTIKKVTDTVQRLRDISPLWDMYNKGVNMEKIKWT
ncbi:MAG: aminotransferase class V-fold PLP-dependent enzyme [Holosporales bacterium]|jgi:cysteine desulfurase|nr:aminotransferase class V-fold PLP-dependent enzyme [Holosporales bacterium]